MILQSEILEGQFGLYELVLNLLFSLGQNQSLGPKLNTKVAFNTTHPPKTFKKVLGVAGD